MAKVKDDPKLMEAAEQRLKELLKTISEMDEKRGRLLIHSGLPAQNRYLDLEVGFKPKRLKRYKRKEVIYAQFGFNAGSEHGGPHWAVVLDNNKQSCPTIMVMPLGSLKEDETEADVHEDDVFLGKIPSINDKLVYAIPNQVRTISKLRIIKPKRTNEEVHLLTNQQMDAIDRKLFQLLFGKSKAIHELIAHVHEVAPAKDSNT